MLDKSQVISIAESAFAPLMCKAEFQNYEHAFGFGVHLPDGSLITYSEKNAALLLNAHVLSSAIRTVRAKIEAKGITLVPWSLPLSSDPDTK